MLFRIRDASGTRAPLGDLVRCQAWRRLMARSSPARGWLALVPLALGCAFVTSRAAAAEPEGTLGTVVVTATRTERTLNDVPESVSVVDAQAIIDTPAQALDEVLRRTPSIDLPNATSYQVHPTGNSISMRGLGGIRALVLLDGVPINDPFFGYMQWSRVPLEFVDQVEVVRGSGSTLWGNYAMGGVINIRTRQPEQSGLVLQGAGGSYGTYRANLTGSLVASDAVRLGLNGGHFHTDGFMQISDADRGPINVPTEFTTNNGALRGDFRLSEGLTAHASVDYFDNDQTLQTRLSTNSQRTWNYSGALTQELSANSNLTLTLFGSDSDFETNNTGGFDGVPENEAEFIQNRHDTPVDDFGSSLVWTRTLESDWLRSLSFGADFHRISGEDDASIYDETGALVRVDVGRGKQRFIGGFAQASIRPLEPLEILASVRYQEFKNYDGFDGNPGGLGDAVPDSTESSFDPRISARYALTSTLALRAAVYSGFRAPNLDNLYRAFSVPFGIFQPNAALKPENLKGGELGFDVETHQLRLQVTGYYNKVDDLLTYRNLDFAELPPGFFFGSRNINAGKARSQGFELESAWQVGAGFSTEVAYTYADSQVTESELDPASVGRQIGGVPRNRAYVALVYQSPLGWRVSPQFRWVEASYADNAHTLPVDEQHIVSLSASYPFNAAFEAYLQVENLLNDDYIVDNSGFNPPLRGTPFSALVGVRMQMK
ncbi:MAG TPA: TonB-dependent receptor [Steroidobacteraceae bacterium]